MCSGGVGSPVRPFARPPDRTETCENHGKTIKIIRKRPKTTKIYRNLKKTTKIALARSPVAESGPEDRCWARMARPPTDIPGCSFPPYWTLSLSRGAEGAAWPRNGKSRPRPGPTRCPARPATSERPGCKYALKAGTYRYPNKPGNPAQVGPGISQLGT